MVETGCFQVGVIVLSNYFFGVIFAGEIENQFMPEQSTIFFIKGELEMITLHLELPDYKPPFCARICVDGVELIPEFSAEVRPYNGLYFGWGRASDEMKRATSLALCRYFFRNEPIHKALSYYRAFVAEFINYWPESDIALVLDLKEFLDKHKEKYRPDHYWHFCEAAMNMDYEFEIAYNPQTGLYILDMADQYAKGYSAVIKDAQERKKSEDRTFNQFSFFAGEKTVLSKKQLSQLTAEVDQIMAIFLEMQIEGKIQKLEDWGR